MDFQRPVRAVKKSFRFVPCLENIIVHGEVAFDATFYLSFPKRKGFADNPQKHGHVHSVTIRQRRRSNCNKPVITWPLGRLANFMPS